MGRAKERYMESAQRAFGPAAQQSAGNVFNIAGEQRQQSREEDINKDIFKSLLNTPAYIENGNIASVVNQGIKSGMIPGSYGIRLLQQHDENQLQRDSMDHKRMQDQVSNARSQQSSERAQQAAMAAQRKAQLGESQDYLGQFNQDESASVKRAMGLPSGTDVSFDSLMGGDNRSSALDVYNDPSIQPKIIHSMAANKVKERLMRGDLPADYNLLVGDIERGDAKAALDRFDPRQKKMHIELLREKGQQSGQQFWDDNAGDFTPKGRKIYSALLKNQYIDTFLDEARGDFQGMVGESYQDYRPQVDVGGAAQDLQSVSDLTANDMRRQQMPPMPQQAQANNGLAQNASQGESLQSAMTTLMGPPTWASGQGRQPQRVPQERQARVLGQPYAYRRY